MSFYSSIINFMRGIRSSVSSNPYIAPTKQYVFGTIISGTYMNSKHDPYITALCLGTYFNPNTRKYYTHCLNLHYADGFSLQWLMKNIYMIKRGGQIINPRYFYQYLKFNNPNIIKKCYRTYHTEMCDFKMISPGFSNFNTSLSYPIKDYRDYFVKQLNEMIDSSYNQVQNNNTLPSPVSYNQTELNEHIIEVMNSHKVFV